MRTLTSTNPFPQFTGLTAETFLAKGLNAVLGAIRHGFQTLVIWQQRASARRQLAEIEPRLMIDAGINEDIVSHETAKPFWRA